MLAIMLNLCRLICVKKQVIRLKHACSEINQTLKKSRPNYTERGNGPHKLVNTKGAAFTTARSTTTRFLYAGDGPLDCARCGEKSGITDEIAVAGERKRIVGEIGEFVA